MNRNIRSRALRLFVALVVGSVAGLAPSVTGAQACRHPTGQDVGEVFPTLDRTDVPTNVEIRIHYIDGRVCPPLSVAGDAPIVIPAGSSDPADAVPLLVRLVSYPGRLASRDFYLMVVEPQTDLQPNTAYEVRGLLQARDHYDGTGLDCVVREEGVITSFVTGASPDTTPPELTTASWGCVSTESDDGADECWPGPRVEYVSTLSIARATDDTHFGLAYDIYEDAADAEPTIPRSLSYYITTALVDPPELGGTVFASYRMDHGAAVVVAVDAAGNRSEPLQVQRASGSCRDRGLDCDVAPAQERGAGGALPLLLLVAAALGMTLWRRRER